MAEPAGKLDSYRNGEFGLRRKYTDQGTAYKAIRAELLKSF
jgi:hypothetical protein